MTLQGRLCHVTTEYASVHISQRFELHMSSNVGAPTLGILVITCNRPEYSYSIPSGRFELFCSPSGQLRAVQGWFVLVFGAPTHNTQAGSFSLLLNCPQCPTGQYQPGSAQPNCLSCPVGQYGPTLGRVVCLNCPAGSYQPAEGQVNCTYCPLGRSGSAQGQQACVPCDGGYFANATGLVNCYPCPLGTFSVRDPNNPNGPTNCTACPAGSFGDSTRAASCKQCVAGVLCCL